MARLDSPQAVQPITGIRRVAAALQTLGVGILIVCVVSRVFVAEHPFRTPPLLTPLAINQSPHFGNTADDEAGAFIDPISRDDSARATHALALLTACMLWLAGGALAGRLHVRHRALAWLAAAFACCSLISALRASDHHRAMLVWWEQLSMVSAGLLAAQVFADRRRFNLLVCVLAAAAAALAAKGLMQVFLEFPATRMALEEHPERLTGMFGRQEGATFSQLVRLRLASETARGFFTLSNMLASLLLVAGAAAVGLMIDRIVAAVRAVAERRNGQRNVDISSPIAAAIVSVAPAALAIVVLVMTNSAGAIGAAGLAGACGVVAVLFSTTLKRHWRRAVLAVAVVVVAVAAATASWGLSQDRLPTKTMTFRWYYWTASAGIVRDQPLLGIGGGNFPDAYLRYRRAEAEESVKAPHNAVVHAAVQYGLIGGAAYLAMLAYVLVGMCRPRQVEQASAGPPANDPYLSGGIIGCAAIVAVVAARSAFGGALVSMPVFIMEAVAPAGVFAFALAGVYLAGRNVAHQSACRFSQLALACGAGAFVVHNMVTFSLWAPGPATAFWVVGGALLARAGGREWPIVRARWPLAVAAGLGVAAAGVLLWWPIQSQTARWQQVNRSLQAGDSAGALAASMAAAGVRGDAMSIAEAARLRVELAQWLPRSDRPRLLREAIMLADRASEQLPSRAAFHNLAANYARTYSDLAGDNDATAAALDHGRLAVELDPMNMQSRLDYAKTLNMAGLREQMLAQLSAIQEIDSRLPKDSVYRLDLGQRKSISRLRAGSGGP